MADVIADAMLEATKKQGAVAAFVNAGGVRSGLEAGPITYGQAISVQPFTNTLVVLELTGSELKKALEEGCEHRGGFLEPSVGTSYRVDFTQPFDSRVSNIVVAGAALDPAKTYPITFLNFTANGGDSHDALKSCSGKRTDTGLIDIDALVDFIKAHTPLKVMPQGRIQTAAQKG
jgi:5'-nucleotidase